MNEEMHQSEDNKAIPMTSVSSGKGREVRPDVYYYTNQIVNIEMVGFPGQNNWVLIDAGMPKSAKEILSSAAERFGRNSRPSAIVLTHGHFDHVGSIVNLIKDYQVPVYAHPLEFPYLTGQMAYPEPDPKVQGGGILAKLSSVYPIEPVNIKEVLLPLPEDHTVPYMPGWEWVHTPGHSPGHVSFFRKSDRTMIAGDAFVTVRQDSLYKVLMQKAEINGPPNYLTTDWQAAWDSVRKLESLQPRVAVTGHGQAMQGEELSEGLGRLAREFDKIAIPEHGKYVDGKD
ncbi:MAG: MBL fold metallo-hydrolase [Ignavibacteria bacterium]|jgi:glyoxylase-like metal-dependent hydrolase (beta-lactamase superfamily II)|nr:MBL fold metallo-hydrolase [Ignavibacteria bacterium]MCU7504281.1 MBL fold metallo-hydrolase [Ignavibacteria bacterium]MCU7516126.1 MBL fold metallo-hydrolase [Ignavibacteria bacterium]